MVVGVGLGQAGARPPPSRPRQWRRWHVKTAWEVVVQVHLMRSPTVALRSRSANAPADANTLLSVFPVVEQDKRPKLRQLEHARDIRYPSTAAHAELPQAIAADPPFCAPDPRDSRSERKGLRMKFHGNTGDRGISCVKEARKRLHRYGTGICVPKRWGVWRQACAWFQGGSCFRRAGRLGRTA